jgi:importin subunit beta-1
MKHADENVALQAVEFWSTVCDEEIELALEAEEAAEYSEAPERESAHFARVALPEILPVLLLLLTKQDEDATDDEWNVSMAAGTCLALLAQAVGDAIVSPIIPFVEGNIKSADWHFREAAVMAFGSILDGPGEKILAPLVEQALPTLIEMMADPVMHVRDTTAWTLGRVSDVLVKTIKLDTHLPPMVAALVSGLEQSPRIVSNCCWTIMNLSEQLGDASADTSPLSVYYDPLVSALLRLAERYVCQVFLSRCALTRFAPTPGRRTRRTPAHPPMRHCPLSLPMRPPTACPSSPSSSLRRLTAQKRSSECRCGCGVRFRTEPAPTCSFVSQGQLVGADDRNNYNELQVNNCSLLTVSVPGWLNRLMI